MVKKLHSKIDFYEGYKYCLDNALNHLNVAERIKDISYGIAYGHLVLATEEAVKASMLLSIHFDKSLIAEIDDFDQYFSNHKHKHEAIRNMNALRALFENMTKIIFAEYEGIDVNSLSREEKKDRAKAGIKNLTQWLRDVVDPSKPNIQLKTNESWWRQAESNKKEGFYVDLVGKKSEWTGPFGFSNSRYDKGFKIADSFVSMIEQAESILGEEEVIKLYKELKDLK